MQATVQRNNTIDSLKLICALLVVFIHCHYPYKREILPITDVAVPLFFCISGYFLYGAKRNLSRIRRIAIIFAWSAALYLLKTELFQLSTLHQLWIPSLHDITNLVIFNDVAFSIHLWYLPAYIYVLIIAFFIDKYNLWKSSFFAIVPLLLVGVFIKYTIAETCPEQIQYYRNAYFTGLPYFLLGAFVKHLPPPILCKLHTSSSLRPLLICSIITLFAARYFLRLTDLMVGSLREINLLLLTGGILLLATAYIQHNDNIISKLGRSYSLYIYIFHLIIMSVCENVALHLPPEISLAYSYIHPWCVFCLSIALTYLLRIFRIIKE